MNSSSSVVYTLPVGLWGVFSSSLKEEARFPYADRELADAKASDLALKYKRTYFVQPIKEPLPEREAVEA